MKRIVLTGDDVDALCRIAPFADRARAGYERPVLEAVHVIDGLAYATDSYRLAFAEVDCDDFHLPASCVEWLPFDGGTITITEGAVNTFVTWDTDNGPVGGKYPTDLPFLTAKLFATMLAGHPPTAFFEPNGPLRPGPCVSILEDGRNPTRLIGEPSGTIVWLDEEMLRETIAALDFGYRIGLPKTSLGPVWFFDEGMTVLQMPVRPPIDLYLRSAA